MVNNHRHPYRLSLAVAMYALATALTPATGWAVPEVHEYVLRNGMKLIVKEDHRAPVVVSQVWYKVGSSYEHSGITGISHVLEHMMFKGTKKHPAGEFSRIIAANGGRENAFTGRDYTAYFQSLEKSRLRISFELESDRMRNLLLPQDEFEKELQVVMEERRLRTEDDPDALTYEQFTAAAFVNGPYHHPIIGWMNDLENLKIEDLRKWYNTWYVPNNATLVVVGDVEPDAVYRLAKKYFGPIKPGAVPELKPRQELRQLGAKRVVVKAPAELPSIYMGFKVPTLSTAAIDWEPYALDVLAGILDGGDSARFARELVRGTQVAAGVSAGYGMSSKYDDIFLMAGTPAENRSVEELETALRAQLTRLREEQVTEDELARVKAQVVAADVYERDSVFYQAMQIGTLETVGLSWRLLDEYVARIRAVTPEQVQQVARKYLSDDKLTVALLDPQPIEGARSPNPRAAGADYVR